MSEKAPVMRHVGADDLLTFIGGLPLARMTAFSGSPLTQEILDKLVAAASA